MARNKKIRSTTYGSIAAMFFVGMANAACDERAGGRVAAQISKDVNMLADFTSISCLVTKDEDNRCGIICVSTLRIPVAQRTPFLATLLASGGLRMRDAGLSKFGNLFFMDKESGENRSYYAIPAARASEVQSGVKAGMISTTELIRITQVEFKAAPIGR